MKNSDTSTPADGLERAKQHLEWPRLEQAVLARCHSPATRRRGLPIAETLAEARTALSETAEATSLVRAADPLPIAEVHDVEAHLAHVERGGALDGHGLLAIQLNIETALRVRAFLGERRDQLPALHGSCEIDPTLSSLETALRDAVDRDGNLHDQASADLRRLRLECSNLRSRIVGKLDEFIDKHRALLSDGFYTIREGRYVVPVRADAHDRVPGIVHATSDSGASLFVEPRGIVAQGNRLKMAEGELEREQSRVLAALSMLVADQLPAVRTAQDALDRYDLRHGGARLANELRATLPELADHAEVTLRAARHPLLELDGVQVVENDILIEAGNGVVISGPNAGGKTVLLKTLGLLALMARAGLPLPVAEGSVLGFFDRIFTDLGDEQSTAKNLSTFSAHVQSLSAILDGARPGALVLLDEVCGGTDPEEGAALACAVVDALCAAGASVLVTTHYEALKAFSLRSPRLRSASVGFDLEQMLPNFSLTLDLPGASSALRVAARFGISQAVVEHAKRVLPQQAKDFDALVRSLQEQAQALTRQRAQVAKELEAAATLKGDYEARLRRLKEQARKKLTAEADKLLSEVREARERVRAAKAELKKSSADTTVVKAAENLVSGVAGRLALGGDLEAATRRAPDPGSPALSPEPPASLSPGDAVYLVDLRSTGTVLEIDERQKRVRVAVGPLKLWTGRQNIRGTSSASSPAASADARAAGHDKPAPAMREPEAIRTRDNTLSLRGLRVDDALPMMEAFIDRLVTSNSPVGYVVHGHGTGALRKAVRQHLQEVVGQVARTRPGNDDEGGDAVTVVYLA